MDLIHKLEKELQYPKTVFVLEYLAVRGDFLCASSKTISKIPEGLYIISSTSLLALLAFCTAIESTYKYCPVPVDFEMLRNTIISGNSKGLGNIRGLIVIDDNTNLSYMTKERTYFTDDVNIIYFN